MSQTTITSMISIEDPALQEIARRLFNIFLLAQEKSALHHSDPASYPITNDPASVEHTVFSKFEKLSPARQNMIVEHTKSTLNSENLRQSQYGILSKVNLKSSTSIDSQVKEIPLPTDLYVNQPAANSMTTAFEGELLGNSNSEPIITDSMNEEFKIFKIGDANLLLDTFDIKYERLPDGTVLKAELKNDIDWRVIALADQPGDHLPDDPRKFPPIDKKYEVLGGEASWLGTPTSEISKSSDGRGRFKHYQNGSIYWSPSSRAQSVKGGIRHRWLNEFGAETGFLGYPTSDETPTPDGKGTYSKFQGGIMYWTPETGVFEIHAGIKACFESLPWDIRLIMGYPTSDEHTLSDGIGRCSHFQRGSIYWTPDTGAHVVLNYIRDKWWSLGAETGFLGYPISDETKSDDGLGRYCNFQGGSIRSLFITPSTPRLITYVASKEPLPKLTLRVTDLRCVSTTSGPGSDEIYLGGVMIIPPDGTVHKIEPFHMGDYDDGTIGGGPWDFAGFRVDHANHNWPKTFTITLALCEQDEGDFTGYLDDLVELLRKKAVEYLTSVAVAYAGAVIGATVLSAVPGLGTLLGAAIGAVIGYLAAEIAKAIKSIWSDYVFVPFSMNLLIPGPNAVFDDGKTIGNGGGFKIRGHGGEYLLSYEWVMG